MADRMHLGLSCSSSFVALMRIGHRVPSQQKAEGDKLVCLSIPGLALVLALAPGPGPVDAAIALAPAAAVTAGTLATKRRHTPTIFTFLALVSCLHSEVHN